MWDHVLLSAAMSCVHARDGGGGVGGGGGGSGGAGGAFVLR